MLDIKKKDNAKRQAEYRQRRLKEGSDQRLNVILDLHAKLALERMAKHYCVTNKNVLERLLLAAQSQLIEQMDAQQQSNYYDGKISTTSPVI